MKSLMCWMSWGTPVKDAPFNDSALRIKNQISTWLSQEAWVGV